jgi:hypothetical protein
MQHSGAADGHASPAVSQNSRACEHRSSSVVAVGQTAGAGAKRPPCRRDRFRRNAATRSAPATSLLLVQSSSLNAPRGTAHDCWFGNDSGSQRAAAARRPLGFCSRSEAEASVGEVRSHQAAGSSCEQKRAIASGCAAQRVGPSCPLGLSRDCFCPKAVTRRGRSGLRITAPLHQERRCRRRGSRGCITPDAVARPVPARLLLLCLLLRSSWLTVEGGRQIGAARVLHRRGGRAVVAVSVDVAVGVPKE